MFPDAINKSLIVVALIGLIQVPDVKDSKSLDCSHDLVLMKIVPTSLGGPVVVRD